MAPDETSSVAAPVEKVERTVTVQGIATHLFEAGPTGAPALLYLHGTFLGNLWLEFHQALSQRFHLFAPDIPGFGLTERRGWMAAELVVWYPERVKKLVLSNAVGIRVKGTPIAHIFAMNPQELLSASFDNFAAAMPLMPSEMNADYLLSQYRQRTTLASLAWNPGYD